MLPQIVGICIGLCIPGYIVKVQQDIDDEIQWNKRQTSRASYVRDEETRKAEDCLDKNAPTCWENDTKCNALLQQYKKGSMYLSRQQWHDVVVPLSKLVR